MKKQLLLGLLVIAAGTMSFVQSDNGKAGYTASAGETSCNASGCHTGHPLNSGTGSVVITAPTMPGWQYTPGQVYPISVTVAQSGVSLFGLGFEALRSTGANGGTLTITNSSQTQLKSKTVGGNSRTNVVHQLNGGASSNSHTFTFNWTAPAASVGNVTFYVSGNAANNNGSESGDYIYTSSQVVTPITTGLSDINGFGATVKTYPNPISDNLNIDFSISEPGFVEISMIGTDGKICDKIASETFSPGPHTITHLIPQTLHKGTYILNIKNNGSNVSRKIMVI